MLTRACHCNLTWVKTIQSINSSPIPLRSILILSSYSCLAWFHIFEFFWPKSCVHFSFPMHAIFKPIPPPWIRFGKKKANSEAPHCVIFFRLLLLPPSQIHIHSTSTKFQDWHYKSICVKEMTLLLFSFRHTSLLTVHTDLHGHTASGCLCRSRPLQWCLMYLSRPSGCPKSSQRDASSSGISLFGTKVISRH